MAKKLKISKTTVSKLSKEDAAGINGGGFAKQIELNTILCETPTRFCGVTDDCMETLIC